MPSENIVSSRSWSVHRRLAVAANRVGADTEVAIVEASREVERTVTFDTTLAPTVTRFSARSGARLGTRLNEPPMPLPPGAAPFKKLLAPRKTSTRSRNSDATYCRGNSPYKPL